MKSYELGRSSSVRMNGDHRIDPGIVEQRVDCFPIGDLRAVNGDGGKDVDRVGEVDERR